MTPLILMQIANSDIGVSDIDNFSQNQKQNKKDKNSFFKLRNRVMIINIF